MSMLRNRFRYGIALYSGKSQGSRPNPGKNFQSAQLTDDRPIDDSEYAVSDTLVIMTTGDYRRDKEAREAGADHFMLKPYPPSALAKAIQDLMAGRAQPGVATRFVVECKRVTSSRPTCQTIRT